MKAKAEDGRVKFKMLPVLEMFTIFNMDHEGKRLARIQKIRSLTCLFLILMLVVVGLWLLPTVKAGIAILSMDRTSGTVGTQVQLTANLTTAEGGYEIRFDDEVLISGNATANRLNASFIVPQATAGNHTVRITDVTTGENGTGIFTVSTAYSMRIDVPQEPKQLQEGDSIPVFVNMTGGESSMTYVANITVQTPAKVTYVKMLNVTTSTTGSGNITVGYPGDFSADANTHIVGNYTIFFNATLGTDSFFVGLTNSTEYHRTQAVDIKAIYGQNENVTITVTGKDVADSVNLTADSAGVVHYANWIVPANASIGTYNITIVSLSGPTSKTPPDVQSFTAPGFAVNVTARNLAGDSVPNVDIKAFENGMSVSNVTTGSSGLAFLKLEIGDYTCQAYSRGERLEKIGERDIEITEATSLDLVCNLTNLGIQVVAVVNGFEIGIPEAGVYLTPDNKTLTTDITGTVVAHSLLPKTVYVLNISRYNASFNVTAIPQLLVNEDIVAWFNVTVFCPATTLEVNVTKRDGQPISQAQVKLQESLGGIHYEGNTDASGMVTFNPIFGRYDVQVYDSKGAKLNSTTVDLFQNRTTTIYCSLYGLTLSVRVVDYFGQPFSNANITLQGEGQQPISHRTQPNGMATFESIVGGNFEVSVYLAGQTQPTAAQGLIVTGSTTLQIKIDKYVILAGFLVETSQLAIAIMIVLTIIVVLSLELYRVRRSKLQKSES